MRILVLCQELPPVGGGGGIAAFKLARQWAQCHQVTYLTQHAVGLPRRETRNGVEIVRCFSLWRKDLDVAPPFAQFAFSLSGLIAGIGLHSLKRFDLVNSHFAVPSGPVGVLLSHILRVPHVLSIHGSDIYNPARRLSPNNCPAVAAAARWTLRHADTVVAQSKDTRDRAEALLEEQLPRPISVIPIAFDVAEVPELRGGLRSRRHALGLESSARYVVAIGRMVQGKGFGNLVRALTLLPDDVRLLIVGSGPLRAELDKITKQKGLADRVVLPGRIVGPEKYRYLACGDVFALPSRHEAFGIVLQEAMAVGLPIVTTSHGGQRDLVEDGVNGLLLSSNEPTELAAAIRRVLDSPAMAEQMSRANRKRVRDFTPERVAGQYMDIFWHLCLGQGTVGETAEISLGVARTGSA